jgi:phosphate starvation-inducible PhoH-like protein
LQNTHNKLVVCYGPAGTGKTLLACNTAIQELKRGNIQRIILTRPVVSVDEEIGYLPGNIMSKMDPWTRPIMDILGEHYSKGDIDNMVKEGIIEISPLAFMRGRTFKHAYIIADEMQNSSPNQMMMLTTRIGNGTRMAITGDIQQSDRCENNGLLDLIGRISHYKPSGIELIRLDDRDVLRSEIVCRLLELYSIPKEQLRPDPNHVCIPITSEMYESDIVYHKQTPTPTLKTIKLNHSVSALREDMIRSIVMDESEIANLERNSELEVAGDAYGTYVSTPLNSTGSNTSLASFGVSGKNAYDDVIIVYGDTDAALIPKQHISRNVIRFFGDDYPTYT